MRRRSLKREGAGDGKFQARLRQNWLRVRPAPLTRSSWPRALSASPNLHGMSPVALPEVGGPLALGSGGRASQVTSGSEATTACVPLGSAPNNTSVVIKTGLPSLWLYETVPGPLEEGGSEDTQECPALEANGPSYKSGFCSGSSLRVCPPPHGKQTNKRTTTRPVTASRHRLPDTQSPRELKSAFPELDPRTSHTRTSPLWGRKCCPSVTYLFLIELLCFFNK